MNYCDVTVTWCKHCHTNTYGTDIEKTAKISQICLNKTKKDRSRGPRLGGWVPYTWYSPRQFTTRINWWVPVSNTAHVGMCWLIVYFIKTLILPSWCFTSYSARLLGMLERMVCWFVCEFGIVLHSTKLCIQKHLVINKLKDIPFEKWKETFLSAIAGFCYSKECFFTAHLRIPGVSRGCLYHAAAESTRSRNSKWHYKHVRVTRNRPTLIAWYCPNISVKLGL